MYNSSFYDDEEKGDGGLPQDTSGFGLFESSKVFPSAEDSTSQSQSRFSVNLFG